MSETYGAQEAQDLVDLTVTVEGFDDWRDALGMEVELEDFWAKEVGKKKATQLEVCDTVARLNRISREIDYFSTLINLGYRLEEAVVSFRSEDREKWGKCTWIKDHKAYKDPKHFWRKMVPGASDFSVSLVGAIFDTEHAGEQVFTLSSVAISSGFLFHKTIVFHRLVFSKPSEDAEKAA